MINEVSKFQAIVTDAFGQVVSTTDLEAANGQVAKDTVVNASYGRNTISLRYIYGTGADEFIDFHERDLDQNVDNESNIASCFLAGTMVNTPSGMKAIESLRQGDVVNTNKGTATVERLVESSVKPEGESEVYTIAKGAFGRNVPSNDVSSSKRHMISNGEKWRMMRTWSVKRKASRKEMDKSKECKFYNLKLRDGDNYMVSGLAAKAL